MCQVSLVNLGLMVNVPGVVSQLRPNGLMCQVSLVNLGLMVNGPGVVSQLRPNG